MGAKCSIAKIIAAGLIGVLATILTASAAESEAEPAAEFFPKLSEREIKIGEALKTDVSLNFNETPLIEIANWFSGKLGVSVQVDVRDVDGTMALTRKIDAITARAAFRLLLDDIKLACVVQDDYLLITTQERAETILVPRVYPVGDLTPVVEQVSYGMGGASSAPHASGIDDSPGAHPPREQSAKNPSPTVTRGPDFDSLIEAITRTVAPLSWDDVGGFGTIKDMVPAECIVVLQTREVHEQLLEMLRAIRAAKRLADEKAG